MIEREISIETADGAMPTFEFHPEDGGPFPIVPYLMDAPSIRPAIKDMASRLASAATESPALVMSPKTARLVRVAMGVLFSSLGAALCKRGARGGAAGGRRRASARPAGAVTLGGGARRAFRGPAEPSSVGYSGSGPRARRGGVRGPRSTATWSFA